MQRRPDRRVVENGERDANLRWAVGEGRGGFPVRPGAIDDRRPAFAAESALIASRAFVILDEVLAGEPAQIGSGDADAAPERRAVLLAALRAMAVQRAEQRACDFEGDAAAQATAADGKHDESPVWRPMVAPDFAALDLRAVLLIPYLARES
jgi:hypothetical protein